MRSRFRRLVFACVVASVAACGARSALIVPVEEDAGVADAADAADVRHRRDVQPPEQDSPEEDAFPSLDVTPPRPDVFNECPDASATLVYVITTDDTLMSFYPPGPYFTTIGTLACPAAGGATPFSMAVDKTGIAYVVYNDGELFEVTIGSLACKKTAFQSGQRGFSQTFGMGFSRASNGIDETLYVASDTFNGGAAYVLGTIDTKIFRLDVVGPFNPAAPNAELTGTGSGDLFAFYAKGGDSAIGQIDKTTARVTGEAVLAGVPQGSAWAFAFWGGDFYTFTAPSGSGSTVVTRYRPSDSSIAQIYTLPAPTVIVGAGVSTCAPQH